MFRLITDFEDTRRRERLGCRIRPRRRWLAEGKAGFALHLPVRLPLHAGHVADLVDAQPAGFLDGLDIEQLAEIVVVVVAGGVERDHPVAVEQG